MKIGKVKVNEKKAAELCWKMFDEHQKQIKAEIKAEMEAQAEADLQFLIRALGRVRQKDNPGEMAFAE